MGTGRSRLGGVGCRRCTIQCQKRGGGYNCPAVGILKKICKRGGGGGGGGGVVQDIRA